MEEEKDEIEIYENDIELYLQLYCEKCGIEDLAKESQGRWNGALRFIQKNVFPNRKKLKTKEKIQIEGGCMASNFNAYDYEKLDEICDLYIDLCFRYDKEISILGFCNLIGVGTETVYIWGRRQGELSAKGFEILEKLKIFREESLSGKLVTGVKNPVGVIAVLNRQFGWASPYSNESNRLRKEDLETKKLPTLEEMNCIETKNNSDNLK